MANSPCLFENLVLSNMGKVDGINRGLEIVGKGTFKFKIRDNTAGHTSSASPTHSTYLN
jgi:hypothetical protein